MNASHVYGGSYLKATDVGSGQKKLTIETVSMRKVGSNENDKQDRLILHFTGTDKCLVLNQTNASEMIRAYGEETDNWGGESVLIATEKVNYMGKMVDGIRIRALPSMHNRNRQQEHATPFDDQLF